MALTPNARPPVPLIIANRETPEVLRGTLAALMRSDSVPALLDVLINGNPSLGARMAHTPEGRDPRCRLWHHPLADKANAINQYLQHIWPGGTVFFVDGYVRVRPDALSHLLATTRRAGTNGCAQARCGPWLCSSCGNDRSTWRRRRGVSNASAVARHDGL